MSIALYRTKVLTKKEANVLRIGLRRVCKGVICSYLTVLIAAGWALSAQTSVFLTSDSAAKPLAYDVVSVKENRSGSYSAGFQILPDGFEATNTTLKNLMESAYGVKGYLISGDPAWLTSTKYDIRAKLAGRSGEEMNQLRGQFDTLLKGSLEERFHIKVHRETKQLPVYDLVLAKGGPKFKEETPEERDGVDKKPNGIARGSARSSNGVNTQRFDSIANLAFGLSYSVRRTVIDKTGLTGKYDFILKWADEDRQQKDDGSAESSVPTVFTALQEQLGLKLQPSKGPVETLVIDHVEQPSEN